MRRVLTLVFGVIPVLFLALLAFAPLYFGISELFDEPAISSLFVAWALAGFFGSIALLRAAAGYCNGNNTLGLLAGIAAAAPLAFVTVTEADFPESLFWGYWTIGPIIVAVWILAERLLFSDSSSR